MITLEKLGHFTYKKFAIKLFFNKFGKARSFYFLQRFAMKFFNDKFGKARSFYFSIKLFYD